MKGSDIIELIRITLGMYLSSARKATIGLLKNWLAIPGSILLLAVFFFIAAYIMAPLQRTPSLQLVAGFVLGMISCAMLSIYYGWIERTLGRETLTWNSLLEFDQGMFSRVIRTAFILWIGGYLIEMFGQGAFSRSASPLSAGGFELVCKLIIFLVFNALSEVVIVRRSSSIDAFSGAFEFLRENAPEWLFPVVVIGIPAFLTGGFIGLGAFLASGQLVLPSLILFAPIGQFLNLSMFVMLLILAPVCHWFTLFRAHLFVELDSSSRRKRLYMARQGS